MKIQFLYSKAKEKNRLVNFYEEYQWFLDNDFPIFLPKFYAKIYERNKDKKRLFVAEITKEFDKIYCYDLYAGMTTKIEKEWRGKEKLLFKILEDLGLKIKSSYNCYISFYGPQGQFQYPNTLDLRTATNKDIKEANETITHELIHLLIYNEAKKLKLDYKETEKMVDSFFKMTTLKNIFPKYKIQKFDNFSSNDPLPSG